MNKKIFRIWLWIDPTRNCNLSCQLCYTKLSHNTDIMSEETLDTILLKLLQEPSICIQMLHLNWRGEPLMNKNFHRLLEIATRHVYSTPIHWHTNGMLLNHRRVDELLLIEGNYTVFFSIDGGTKQTHDNNRGSGSFEKSIAGLRLMLKARGDRSNPKIGLYQLDLGVPLSDYDMEYRSLIEEVDEWIKVSPVYPTQVSANLFQNDIKMPVRKGIRNLEGNTQPLKQPEGACFWAGNSLNITPTGDTYICLLSHSTEGYLGNLVNQSALQILNNAYDFRRNIITKGRSNIVHCAGCHKPDGEVY